jgi:hypothetical protein
MIASIKTLSQMPCRAVSLAAPVLTISMLKPTPSLNGIVLRSLFGSSALFLGLKVTNHTQSLIAGWFAGLCLGFAGIAFLLWFYANPVN